MEAGGSPNKAGFFMAKGIINRASSQGLYANIAAKRERIAQGSGERMRRPGEKGAPSDKDFKNAAKTAKK